MDIKGVYINRDLNIFTLHSLPRKPAFLNLWEAQRPKGPKDTFKWKAVKTLEVHEKTCTGMRMTRDEEIICVQSCLGHSIQVNTDLNNFKTGERIHKMPISSIGWTENGYITGSTDYSYHFVKFSTGIDISQFLAKLAVQLGLFLLFVFWIIDYLV